MKIERNHYKYIYIVEVWRAIEPSLEYSIITTSTKHYISFDNLSTTWFNSLYTWVKEIQLKEATTSWRKYPIGLSWTFRRIATPFIQLITNLRILKYLKLFHTSIYGTLKESFQSMKLNIIVWTWPKNKFEFYEMSFR